MLIYVDADACPVKDEILRVAERHGLTVRMVSNSWMRLPESPLVSRVIVAEGSDAADDWIAGRILPGDIAITQDIPLAARCVKAGGKSERSADCRPAGAADLNPILAQSHHHSWRTGDSLPVSPIVSVSQPWGVVLPLLAGK